MGALPGTLLETEAAVASALNARGWAFCATCSGPLAPKKCPEHPKESVESETALITTATLRHRADRHRVASFSGYVILSTSSQASRNSMPARVGSLAPATRFA